MWRKTPRKFLLQEFNQRMLRDWALVFLLGVSASVHGDGGAPLRGCDWALEKMSMAKLDAVHEAIDEQGRMVFMGMSDIIEVQAGKACSSGGASVCTAIAIINRHTGRVKMAHLAGQLPQEGKDFISSSMAELTGPEGATNIQVVMAGNQTAVNRANPQYNDYRESSVLFEKALREELAAQGVSKNQIRSFLSSEPEQYVYDLTVDTKTKKIYLARKKVKLNSRGEELFQ